MQHVPQGQGMSSVVQHKCAWSRTMYKEAQCIASNAQHAVKKVNTCSHTLSTNKTKNGLIFDVWHSSHMSKKSW